MKTVIFKVTEIVDKRNWGSSLEVGIELSGLYRERDGTVWWDDPANGQGWVFYTGYTCEIIRFID